MSVHTAAYGLTCDGCGTASDFEADSPDVLRGWAGSRGWTRRSWRRGDPRTRAAYVDLCGACSDGEAAP